MHKIKLWVTREYGRNWMGCGHGMPASGVNPVRICDECFEKAIRDRILADAEKETQGG